MDAKLLLCSFYIILNFDLSTSYGASDADASVVMSDGLTTYKTTLNACKVDADLSKLIPELRGPKGEQGDTGEDGERGDPGTQGPVGPSGRNGEKGDKGPRGPQGPPGNDGTCLHVCRMEIDDDFSSGSLESTSSSEKALSKKLYGTKDKPSPTLCNTKQNDEEFEGTIWVNEKNPFQVYCEEKTYRTCIIPSTTSDPASPGNEINYMKDTRAFWLSEKGFDMQRFYGNITMNQIEWLQRRSSSVTQKIRFNCKNSYIDEPATSLRMLGWNHIIIDHQSGISPQAYSWDVNDCAVGKSTSKWGSAELVIKSKYPRRLPIIDFQIRDIRKDDQSISVELMELCFG